MTRLISFLFYNSFVPLHQTFFMEVHFDKFKFQVFKPVVTIGTFDGVHKGHQYVVNTLKEIAMDKGGETVIISFEPHPKHVVGNTDKKMPLLNTLTEKIYQFEKLGVDHLLILSFTPTLANLSYQDFFETILLSKIHIDTLLVGYDHRLGKNRKGNFDLLANLCQKHNITIAQTQKIAVENSHVSSSRIRELLYNGKVEYASKLLSYDYSITGKVTHGDKIGRKLGFPTANIIKNNPHKLTPKSGVYAVKIKHDSILYKGMLNIGVRPSVSIRNEKNIEVHIFDFDKTIYDENIEIVFVKHIRDEYKFDEIEALKSQLQKDKETITFFFKNI